MSALLKPCIKCGKPGRDYACPEHKASYKTNPAYSSPTYQRNRAKLVAWAWDNNIPCWLCGLAFQRMADITADHIVPLSKGGSHQLHNLAAAHRSCNSKRGAMRKG